MGLWDALTAGARAGDATLRCWVGDRFESAHWSEVSRDAERMTAGFRRAGIQPGSRVAAILTNSPQAVRGILGTWLAGGTLASFPVPARGMSLLEYVEQLGTLCDDFEPVAMFVDEPMVSLLREGLRERTNVRSWESVADSGRVDPAPPTQDEVAFLQYSSGSTSTPSGCMLTPRAIEAQIALLAEMLELRPGADVDVSWLPLSHDMGIFGNLITPWAYGVHLVLSTPERFMMAPRTWFGDIAEAGATITVGTNTALALAARAQRSARFGRPLRLHSLILGAERLEWETLQRALDVFEPFGLSPEQLMPAYGLAEATLAVTHTPRREAPRHITVDGLALADGDVYEVEENVPAAARIVSSGVPCAGVELRGLDEDRLNEIRVRSPSMAVGYHGDDQRTRARFVDGEVLTRDLGFIRGAYLYPVGRADDVISVGGRKVYAREIEAAIDAMDGVRRGCSTVIETRDGGAQHLTLLIELKDNRHDIRGLAEQAASMAMSKAAVALDRCVFLENGTLPKTPTGKIQRYRCRELLDAGRLKPLDTVELAVG